MSNLVREVNRCRVDSNLNLYCVNPDTVWAGNPHNRTEIAGRIAEAYVKMWLDKCPGVSFDSDFPRNVNGFTLRQTGAGVEVLKRNGNADIPLHEFDFLIGYDGQPIVVHVKSSGLNGIEQKIPESLDYARHIYGRDGVGMLLFFPQSRKGEEDAQRIQSAHPEVVCVDSGYDKKELKNAVDIFYEQTGIRQWNYPNKRRKRKARIH